VNAAAGGGELSDVTFGHPSGTLKVGAKATQNGLHWEVEQVTMSRSARVLMEGWVRIPEPQI
jgi:2-methylaconitate cis-trans-isomerase PrpF